jgi:hypothetical protein
MNERRGVPVAKQPTCSRTHNKYSFGLQTTIKSHQKQPLDSSRIQRSEEPCNGSHIRHIEGLSGGLCTQHDGGVVDERHLNPNVKHKEILMKLSVGLQERSTMLYSPAREPKVLDKHVRHIDNRQGAEAHNTPQPTEGNCGKQFLNQQDAFGHQWSLCDSHHTSHDTTRERIAEGGGMEYMHPTHPTHHIHGPYWDQDSADSLLSESEVVNEEFGTRHGVSDEPDEQSECSENLVNTLNEIYGSNIHSDQQSEAVHMACI